jgi:hypothetical protein
MAANVIVRLACHQPGNASALTPRSVSATAYPQSTQSTQRALRPLGEASLRRGRGV